MKAITLTLTLCLAICGCFACHPSELFLGDHQCISVNQCYDKQFVQFENLCLRACPPGTFYSSDTRKCFNECPRDTVPKENLCLNGTFCIGKGKVLFNRSCHDDCPKQAAFTKYGTCYEKCPNDTVVYGTTATCIFPRECWVDKQNYIFNGTCQQFCPQEAAFINSGRCQEKCDKQTVLFTSGSRCHCISVIACNLKHRVIFNDTCLPVCPEEAQVLRKGVCGYSCPPPLVVSERRCINERICLTYHQRMIFNGSCLSECPIEAPWTLYGRCFASCPDGRVSRGRACIDANECRLSYRLIFSGSCLDACPAGALYASYGQCVVECLPGTFLSDMQCRPVSSCSYYGNFLYNGSCLVQCPEESPFIKSGHCVVRCPSEDILTFPECSSSSDCVKNKSYIFNNTCIASCPTHSRLVINNTCFSECPDGTVLNGTECIYGDVCTRRNRIFNRSCVAKCPERAPFELAAVCYRTCPNTTVTDGLNCIGFSLCTSSRKVYNGTCVAVCPDEAAYSFAGRCHQACPSNTTSYNGYDCVDESQCRHVPHIKVFNGTCVTQCPGEAIYDHSGTCLTACPKGLLSKNYTCIEDYKCDRHSYVKVNDSCLSSCPNYLPYKWEGDCFGSCAGIDNYVSYLSNGTVCIPAVDCSSKNWYSFNGTCISVCPSWTTELSRDNKCVDVHILLYTCIVMGLLLIVCIQILIMLCYNPKSYTKIEENINIDNKEPVVGPGREHDGDDDETERVGCTEDMCASPRGDVPERVRLHQDHTVFIHDSEPPRHGEALVYEGLGCEDDDDALLFA